MEAMVIYFLGVFAGILVGVMMAYEAHGWRIF